MQGKQKSHTISASWKIDKTGDGNWSLIPNSTVALINWHVWLPDNLKKNGTSRYFCFVFCISYCIICIMNFVLWVYTSDTTWYVQLPGNLIGNGTGSNKNFSPLDLPEQRPWGWWQFKPLFTSDNSCSNGGDHIMESIPFCNDLWWHSYWVMPRLAHGKWMPKQLKSQERTLELQGWLDVLHSLAQTGWKFSLFGNGQSTFCALSCQISNDF